MTNYEHYKKEIANIVRLGRTVAIEKETGRITTCNDMLGTCMDCLFYHGGSSNDNCYKSALKWADAEYIEPGVDWTKVPVDTPILVRDDNSAIWKKRHFHCYEEGYVYAFNDGHTSWTDDGKSRAWLYAKLAEGEQR